MSVSISRAEVIGFDHSGNAGDSVFFLISTKDASKGLVLARYLTIPDAEALEKELRASIEAAYAHKDKARQELATKEGYRAKYNAKGEPRFIGGEGL